MGTKELLRELIEYLEAKYSVTGSAAAEQIDGCMSSAASLAMNAEDEPKTFKLVLRKTE
ncbi:MAG: hypothetical protein FWE62_04920 [Firmicutes bacterium]|nr:hypothetical protein [Bacillota bacterium]